MCAKYLSFPLRMYVAWHYNLGYILAIGEGIAVVFT